MTAGMKMCSGVIKETPAGTITISLTEIKTMNPVDEVIHHQTLFNPHPVGL